MSRPCRVVLVVHDDRERARLSRPLRDAGFWVTAVATSTEAEMVCGLDAPEVLVLDTAPPDLDSFDTCAYLNRELRDADPLIILLAEVRDSMTRGYLAQMARFVGADFFIAKPCDVNLLLAILEDLGNKPKVKVSGGHRNPPTRVTWPTSRNRPLGSGGLMAWTRSALVSPSDCLRR